ncbi:DUF58 domain-containing protein, partial [Streptosporangium carneum]
MRTLWRSGSGRGEDPARTPARPGLRRVGTLAGPGRNRRPVGAPGRLANAPRLSGTGTAVTLGGAVLLAAGLAGGYPGLAGVGAAAQAVVVLAVVLVSVPVRLGGRRTVTPDRVTVNTGAVADLEIRNAGRLPTGWVEVKDLVDGAPSRVAVPPLAPGATARVEYALATPRRGLLTLGPLLLERRDPLGLARRTERAGSPARLWVRPRVHPLRPSAVGSAPDVEGPLDDRAPRGTTTFASLREYRPGDDPRQIHWRSTARSGSLIVRERVDTAEPTAA